MVRHDLSARAEGRHRAVADRGQAGGPDNLADVGNLRQREWVIGRLAGHNRHRPWQAERIEHRHGHLHLRQIGAMILAVPKLAQPFGRHLGCSRRGVDADHASWQVVDTQHGLLACTFTGGPVGSDAQGVEDCRQPLIGPVARFDLVAEAPTEGTPRGCAPWLDAREPVVALGEEEGQPHDGRPAETPSLPMAIGREVGIQSFGHAHFLERRDEGRDVVYAFVGCCDLLAHPTSLTQFSFSRENSREM